jgi:hypothetical protein
VAPRTNTFSNTTPGGLHVQAGNHSYQSNFLRSFSSRSDHTGEGDCAPFTVQSWEWNGGRINKAYTSWWESDYYNYIAEVLYNDANFPHLEVTGIPSNVEAATSAVARTNPSAAIVDVPVSLFELREIIMLLKKWGDDFLSLAGRKNIEFQFGVRPILSDLSKLLDFQQHVERRVKVLQKLATEKGYRRTVDIGVYSAQATPIIVCQSVGRFIDRPFLVNTRVGMRSHVRWVCTQGMGDLLIPGRLVNIAQRVVTGSTIDFSTLWEAMPWSWLLDWATNFGQFLKAHRNMVPASLQGVHIMKHTKTIYTSNQWGPDGSGLVMEPIRFLRETKQRSPSFTSPIAHFPFLNGTQMGIVASLAVMKR